MWDDKSITQVISILLLGPRTLVNLDNKIITRQSYIKKILRQLEEENQMCQGNKITNLYLISTLNNFVISYGRNIWLQSFIWLYFLLLKKKLCCIFFKKVYTHTYIYIVILKCQKKYYRACSSSNLGFEYCRLWPRFEPPFDKKNKEFYIKIKKYKNES